MVVRLLAPPAKLLPIETIEVGIVNDVIPVKARAMAPNNDNTMVIIIGDDDDNDDVYL